MKNKINKVLFLFIGILFIWSAILKLIYPEVIGIFNYSFLNRLLYILLIQVELILGLGLILKPTKLIIYSGLMLTLLFVSYSFIKIITDVDSNCGCFGSVFQRNTTTSFIENIILLFLYLIATILFDNNELFSKVVDEAKKIDKSIAS